MENKKAKNVSSKSKICKKCGTEYRPTSNRQEYCPECIRKVDNERCRVYYKKTKVYKGYNQKGENNNNWKGGIGSYKRDFTLEGKVCEACGSDKKVIRHHVDHNRYNNTVDNIVYLCRACHAKHHFGKSCEDPVLKIERIHSQKV